MIHQASAKISQAKGTSSIKRQRLFPLEDIERERHRERG